MGISEIFFILFMVLILFGADKLPEIARGLGKAARQVREATDEIKNEIQRGVNEVTPQYIRIHFPSSRLLQSFYHEGY